MYAPGQFNKTALTIGFHIYGSSNIVYMSQEILTEVRVSAGMRIDGLNDNLIIERESKICANGEDGIGLLVSYGKDHNMTHNGTITATGEGGIGMRFDFGHNTRLGVLDYRGSFIRHGLDIEEYKKIALEAMAQGTALPKFILTDLNLLDELNGPLVKDLWITGSIKASSAAIYISENAFVENIHILNGARIEGDIVSNWNTANPEIQHPEPHTLNTKLIFGNNPKSEITYESNITAKGAMDVIIDKGRLNYHGKMSGLRHFEVEPDATFSINAAHNNPTYVEAQEIKLKQGSVITCYRPFTYKLKPEEVTGEKTILEFVSENIDNQSDISCTYEASVSFYDYALTPNLKWTKSEKGLILNLIFNSPTLNELSISTERIAVKAVGAPLIVAAYDMSANAIFDKTELSSNKKETDVWCSPDIAFSAQAKTDSKYSVNSKATVFGIDRKITDYLLLGIGGNVAQPKYTSDDANVDVEHLSGFMYGAANLFEEANLSFFIKGGRNLYSQDRSVREEKYHSDYEGKQYNLGLKIDRPLRVGKEIKVKPFASYECIMLDVDSYGEGKEKGQFALKFDKSATKTHRINIGTGINYDVTKIIDLNTSVFYSSLYGNRNTNVLVKYAQDEDVSEISHGDELDKHSIGVGLNFTLKPTNCTNVALGYALTAGKNCTNNRINANFSLKF